MPIVKSNFFQSLLIKKDQIPKLSITMNITIEKLLNKQIAYEHQASFSYLNMATWADLHECRGAAHFLYNQSQEERAHMMKIVDYLIILDKRPLIPTEAFSLKQDYPSIKSVFEEALINEKKVTQHVHKIATEALAAKDFNTFEFLQWFIAEQREEEDTIGKILGMFATIDREGVAYYHIDQAIKDLGEDN